MFLPFLLSCSYCSCCPDYNNYERLLVLSRDRYATVQESMREITETDEFEKLVGAGGNQIILRKYFDILAVFFGCKSIPISLSQLVFCSIKNKIIEHKNHTESYSLKRSQIFPFPAHCLKQSKTGRDTSRQVKTNQAAFAVTSFYDGFLDNCKSMKDLKMFTFYV